MKNTTIINHNYSPTNRTFRNVETGHNARLYTSHDNSQYHLIYEGQHEEIADGCEVNGFYISAHTGAEIKLNTGKKIFVDRLEFYNCKEGEKVTHRKFIGFSRFSKL
jgi:hypothetical protein